MRAVMKQVVDTANMSIKMLSVFCEYMQLQVKQHGAELE